MRTRSGCSRVLSLPRGLGVEPPILGETFGELLLGDAFGEVILGDWMGDMSFGEAPLGDTFGEVIVGDWTGDVSFGDCIGERPPSASASMDVTLTGGMLSMRIDVAASDGTQLARRGTAGCGAPSLLLWRPVLWNVALGCPVVVADTKVVQGPKRTAERGPAAALPWLKTVAVTNVGQLVRRTTAGRWCGGSGSMPPAPPAWKLGKEV